MPIFERKRGLVEEPAADPFPGVQNPAELKQLAGSWVASGLDADGFKWVKAGEVVRKIGTRREYVSWTASKYNSAATGSKFDMFAVIMDLGLERWRGENADRVTLTSNFVTNQAHKHHALTLSVGDMRQTRLDDALRWYRQVPLPWFDMMRNPDRMVREVDRIYMPASLVEWLMWLNRDDLVPALLERVWHEWRTGKGYTEKVWDSYELGTQLARDGEPASKTLSSTASALGWLLERNGYTDPRLKIVPVR
ncbi:MAG: hypothetical protein JWL79_2956 [Frankiales bacterium]|nr:hypothetical protein [Frankiales bacterium]